MKKETKDKKTRTKTKSDLGTFVCKYCDKSKFHVLLEKKKEGMVYILICTNCGTTNYLNRGRPTKDELKKLKTMKEEIQKSTPGVS